MRIFCDFDGTISLNDTTDFVLSSLADPAWRDVEADWVAGRISAAECMRRQIAMINGTDAELDAVLDQVEIDPGFVEFVAWADANAISVTILSDGVDYFISRLLARIGLSRLPVVANRLAGEPGRRELDQPWVRYGCAGGTGVCKCVAAGAVPFRSEDIVFIGDGTSDFCVSRRVDILFAKDRLATYAKARGRRFHPFDSFTDITMILAALVDAQSPQQAIL